MLGSLWIPAFAGMTGCHTSWSGNENFVPEQPFDKLRINSAK